jgi:hypothetical protein
VSRLTRRGLFTAAAAAGLARPALAGAAASEPATVLALIRREDAAAAAYALAAQTNGHAMLERIARIDERHAHALRVQLESLTVTPTHRPPHAERADPVAGRLAATGSLADAIALEHELVAAYVGAARALPDAGLLQTVATIAGSHAQQLSVLRAAAGRPPLDEPEVSGR